MDVNTEERYDDEWNESMGTEIFIMKRSGERVPFDIKKIINAISKANSEMTNPIDKLSSTGISDIAESIFKQAQALDRDLSVEEIQDKVEDLIMVSGKCELARAYITYRYKHNEARKKSTLDKKIEGIINVKVNKDGTVSGGNEEVNQENSNKDTKVLSVQRDYMAGEWSRDYTRKHLLPPEVMTAHDLGIIHVHDTDYQAQPEHNCFSAKTEFITRNGVTTFANCKDGEIVEVLDKDGHWKKATVRYYGKQRLYDIILKAGNSEKKVVCTQNHRWILKDGTVTTNLKEGDSLYALHTAESFDLDINTMSNREKEMFVLGFIIGDGTDYKNGMKARLCNTKTQYAKIFEDCGYSTRPIKDSNDIEAQKPCKLSKQKFLKSNGWRYLSSNDKEFLFKGFYAADGSADRNQVTTSNKQVLKMVCEISAIAGYHISSIDTVNHDTNFKENATLHVINFRIEQKPNKLWKVESIKYHRKGNLPQNVWCVEEPETHSFTLAGGIVTGNCCLINLEDMLQNGTCISGTWIDTPKSFSTATTVASQIIAQVASQQYGGQTISLAHLAPFVDVSRQKLRKRFSTEWKKLNIPFTEEQLNDYVEAEVRKEVESGCQTIQYQLITLQTTNGQAPFVTVFMYLNEARNEQEKKDLAMLIEVMLKQRMKGVKDASGAYITPAFPKLIYCLQEDNIREGTPYWYLTVLAAKCTAKRMVPDYISEKKMLELKGDVYPCMGCVDGKEVITYKYNNNVYTESFERMWDRLSKYFEIGKQPNLTDFVMRTPGVKIYDQKEGFVDNYGIIKNHNSEWLRITFSNSRTIMCTPDHPFENTDGKLVYAADLTENDLIDVDTTKDDTLSPTCYITSVEHIHEDSFSYDVTTASEHFTVSGIYSHNCRSFLTPDRFTDAGIGNIANALNYVPGKHKYYGRFNQGVVTINLVDVACSSHGDEETFWKLMTERLELCHKALRSKHERLLGTPSDVAPIQWQYGALARLKPGEVIDPLLFNGYSTISLGYAGLAECVYYMKHVSHTSDEGKEFGLRVMQALNDACNKWKSEENIDYSVYGTPLESTTYKFAKCLQRRFGKIPHVTDKNYITNSYHVHVTEHIDAFSKLSKESEFQKLSPGGAISYVEVPNMQGNIPAVLAIIQHIYNTILYAELNTKSDHCENCGYDGEIKIIHKDGKLAWQCPQCGCTDQNKMHVARRTCGYIGTQYWNQGRTQEIAERVLHVAVEDESTPPETDTTSAE